MENKKNKKTWRKQKKQKNKKKQYLVTLWGEAPGRKPKKPKKPRENTKKQKKKQYLGTLGWTPLSTKTSGFFFGFLEFFLVFQLSDSQDLWKIVFRFSI